MIDEYVLKLQNAPIEYAYGFVRPDHIAWGIAGNDTGVTVPARWIRTIEGRILLHNHPREISVEPSSTDIETYDRFHLGELWIVNNSYLGKYRAGNFTVQKYPL